jgi:serine/threonine protein kinase
MGDLSPGSLFADHRIEAVAGRGGMGVVYRARQLSLDRTVALKVIAPALIEDPAIRRRFLRESKIAASIDHPNVIPIYYTGEEDGVAFIAMRYVPGDDLRTLIVARARFHRPVRRPSWARSQRRSTRPMRRASSIAT